METWADIAGFEGCYQVSDAGRVRSLDRFIVCKRGTKRFYQGKVLQLKVDRYGYSVVMLRKRTLNIRKSVTVHRLVAETFITNPEEKPTINHINGNKTDNRAENLEWATHKENTDHAITTGLIDVNMYRRHAAKNGKESRKTVLQLQGDNVIGVFDSITEASLCVTDGRIKHASSIGAVCRGERLQAYGYQWKFAN